MALEPGLVLLVEAPTLALERLGGEVLLEGALTIVEGEEERVSVGAGVESRVLEERQRLLRVVRRRVELALGPVRPRPIRVDRVRPGRVRRRQQPSRRRVRRSRRRRRVLRHPALGHLERLQQVLQTRRQVIDRFRRLIRLGRFLRHRHSHRRRFGRALGRLRGRLHGFAARQEVAGAADLAAAGAAVVNETVRLGCRGRYWRWSRLHVGRA